MCVELRAGKGGSPTLQTMTRKSDQLKRAGPPAPTPFPAPHPSGAAGALELGCDDAVGLANI